MKKPYLTPIACLLALSMLLVGCTAQPSAEGGRAVSIPAAAEEKAASASAPAAESSEAKLPESEPLSADSDSSSSIESGAEPADTNRSETETNPNEKKEEETMSLLDQAMKGSGQQTAAGEARVLKPEWLADRRVEIQEVNSLEELKAACDVTDPGSVAAYWVYSVLCLTADYDTGMEMMKYLFADLEPYGRGFTEGGVSGKAGWDSYFNERLKDDDYRWLPRAYFEGAVAENGFHPGRPLAVKLYYNKPNTEALNAQSQQQLGRLNIVYWVQSNAAGNRVNLEVTRFDGSDRYYVTKGSSSSALFYDQRAGLTAEARAKLWD